MGGSKQVSWVICAWLALGCNCACAEIVTMGIAGQVTYVDDGGDYLGGYVDIGDTFTGNYVYESDTMDSNPLDLVGEYWYASVPFGMSLRIGDLFFQTDPSNVAFLMGISDGHVGRDMYLIMSYNNLLLGSGIEVSEMSWQLSDYSSEALSTTDLPLVAPVLDDWESNYLIITLGEKGGTCIGGTVTDVWLVPEPGTMALLSLGGLLAFRRRRSR